MKSTDDPFLLAGKFGVALVDAGGSATRRGWQAVGATEALRGEVLIFRRGLGADGGGRG